MNKILAILLALVMVFGCVSFAEEEDGQNPVMNIIGFYQDEAGQRATMYIEAAGDTDADVLIEWSNDADSTTIWEFTGNYDYNNGVVTYEDCLKINLSGEDNEEVVYENGTGKLIVGEDWTILWQDDAEDAGKDCVFTYTSAEGFADEDLQNPVMNIIGSYTDAEGGRAYLTIDAQGETNGGYYLIEWANSAEECCYWEFTGDLEEDNTVTYSDCVKTVVTFDEEGTPIEENVVYENGTGKLTIGEDWSITWQDDVEDAGNGCLFTFDVEEEANEAWEEDSQNPVMNIIGIYADETSERAVLTIGATGNDEGIFSIAWSDSAEACVYWEFTGRYDTESNTVSYSDCVKSTLVFDEDGNITSEDIAYENGTGKLTIGEDWSITWQDDMEDAGHGCRFSFGEPDEIA